MVAESEFLRHVNERVRNWRQDDQPPGSGSGTGSSGLGLSGVKGMGGGSTPRLLLDGDRLLLPSYGWVEKDPRMQTPN